MAEPLSPEQRAHDVATFLSLPDDGIAQRVITSAIRAAETAAVEAERARCLKAAEDAADNSSRAESPYDGGGGRMGYEMACGDIADAIRTPATEADNAR